MSVNLLHAQNDSILPYPIEDRAYDHLTQDPGNSLDLDDPRHIKKEVKYDPETGRFMILETIGGRYFRNPTYLTFEEFLEWQRQESVENYFEQRSRAIDFNERESHQPKLYIGEESLQPFMQKFKVDIQPRGSIDITLGVTSQKVDNPTLREDQRKQTNFDFDMNIQMNVTGQIGDFMKLNTNFNTKTTFNFENQIKLAYEGKEDKIIKLIEAGNVSLPLRGTLIRGSQSLFGLKTQLQFGRLYITNILSQQKSETENIVAEGGSQLKEFELKGDEYEENKHYYFAHYFRDTYEDNLDLLPVVNTPAVINRIEVWVTNKTRQTENIREIVVLSDLGERSKLVNPGFINPGAGPYPNNGSNTLYNTILQNQDRLRDPTQVISYLENNLGLQPIDEFEKTSARKLSPTEYTFHERLGYISLNQTLKPDDVLGVAIEYTVNGQVFKIGEFASDLPPSTDTTNIKDLVLVLKMLKGTSIRTNLPIWDLMMKNVYSLQAFQVNPEDFLFEVYYADPGGGDKRYLPNGGDITGKRLISVLGLDKLNNQLDPQPDGVFDFIPNVTINSRTGRVYFPVVEPFGDFLREAINNDLVANQVVYDILYDSTKVSAQQRPEYNRFIMKGRYKSSVSNEIRLNAFNIPRGSVTVTAGGQVLQENVHYTVDYNLGRVRIIDEGIANSGVPVNVQFENNTLFGLRSKSLIGTRLDYKISDKINIGATHMRLAEKPFTEKVNVGDDPISNNIVGMDFNYETESEAITRGMNKISFSESTSPSRINVSGEVARFFPGHAKAVDQDNAGVVYVDDFEGSSVKYDIKFPFVAWELASTPKYLKDRFGNELFPEANISDSLVYGFNRARMAWYQIDGTFYNSNSSFNPLSGNRAETEGLYTRLYFERQIFPNRENANLNNPPLYTFDLAYEPNQRGPYNFDVEGAPGISSGINPDGTLKDPETRWAGVMRAIQTNDFEASNVEFIEFWLLDPFLNSFETPKGKLLIHLGTISEDILKDSRKLYENGLPRPNNQTRVDTSAWGVTPTISNAITNSFDSDPDVISAQDAGLDGLSDEAELAFHTDYLDRLSPLVSTDVFNEIQSDPSNDNYIYPIDDGIYGSDIGIIERYRKYNGTQGNSSYNAVGDINTNGNARNQPDDEDLNDDNTLNEIEEYYQYTLDFNPVEFASSEFVVDRVVVPVSVDGRPDSAVWYQVKIPIEAYDQRVGNIQDFRSIKFMRMVMTGFEEPVVMRFAELGLIRNQWRRYSLDLEQSNESIGTDDFNSTEFNVSAISVEENSGRTPIPYAIPPGISRETTIGGVNNAFQNEQSLSLQVCELNDGDARAIYKVLDLDLRNYNQLKMFAHAESLNTPEGELLGIQDGDLNLFMRIGSDFTENYYEYELPLAVTSEGNYNPNNDNDRLAIWPAANNLDVPLDTLTKVKLLRNTERGSPIFPYYYTDYRGNQITIKGNPDLGRAAVVMIGIRNPKKVVGVNDGTDDGMARCAEVWINELRLAGFDENGGWAALGRVDMQLGDIGNLSVAGSMHTIGFGQLDQRLDQRYQDNFYQIDVAANLEMGKFLPPKAGLQIPVYANFSHAVSTPKYDPYELDVELDEVLNAVDVSPEFTDDEKEAEKERLLNQARDVTTIKSVNVTNMKKIRTNTKRPARVYDVENFDVSYSFTQISKHNPTLEEDEVTKHRGSLGWNHNPQPKYWTPFKKLTSTHKYLKPIKELNFNPMPSTLSFRTDIFRQFGQRMIRDIGDDGLVIEPTYDKYFTWDRFYDYKHNLTRSISIDYSAVVNTRIDEPAGAIDTEEKKDSLKQSFWSFGRKVNYEHRFNASYNVPFKNIPVLDWMTGRVRYNSTFGWTAASLAATNLGNITSNSRDIQVNGELNMKNLYNKLAFLKPYSTPSSKKVNKENYLKSKERVDRNRNRVQGNIDKKIVEIDEKKLEIEKAKLDTAMAKADIKVLKKDKKKIRNQIRKLKDDKSKMKPDAHPVTNVFLQPILGIKRVSVTFDERRATTLPGFLPTPKLFGQDFDANAPGFGFLFGAQRDTSWLSEAADQNWLTSDTTFYYQYLQSKQRNLSFKVVFEPLRDFRVDINWDKSWTENYTEYFKKISAGEGFQHLSPATTGNYSISFVMLRTMFDKLDENNFSEAFREFENLRSEYSEQFNLLNPNSNGNFIDQDSVILSQYFEGYGPYSQDVLIPAFIAAYTGKDVSKVKLNPLKTVPLPNWRLTYTGLAKYDWAKKVFKNFKLSHGYSSTFSIGNYASELSYQGTGGFTGEESYFVPSALDSLSNNYYGLYNIPQIQITEILQPLIGIDITWVNGLTSNFEYKRSRTLGFSFLDYQLSENRSAEFTGSIGYNLTGITMPFKIKGKAIESDINFRFDISHRADRTVNYKIDQDIAEPTRGAKTLTFSPTIDYVVNKQLNIRLFYEFRKTTPATLASYPVTTGRGGVTIRFNLEPGSLFNRGEDGP
ncbi:MAG: cell surface protein SprA [Bacteroidetes bacterium]|nr:cell surface protein SprA [Bacteroidota bacterium]